MFNQKSIFNRLIVYNLPVAIIPFVIILIVIYFLLCMDYKNDEYSQLKSKMNEYTQSIEAEKKQAIQKSDYIIRNPEVIEVLKFKTDDLSKRLIMINRLGNYVEQINNSSERDLITIYSDNCDLLTSRFTEHISELPNLGEIKRELEFSNYLYFHNKISYDKNGDMYFVLFRKIFIDEETILQIKIYLPETSDILVKEKLPKYENRNKYVTVPLTYDLVLTAPINTKTLSRQYAQLALWFLLIGIAFCVIIIYASFVINRKTTKTINSFINDLSSGIVPEEGIRELSAQSENFELNTICTAINSLVIKVNEANDKLYKTELEKRRLRLELLQSKINPHVLYNSLASISHKAYKSGDVNTFEIIENLVSYYRLVLARGREFVTLEEELKMIEKYVSINEISHSEKYNFVSEIAPELKNRKILHLILQPFIENAIVHGLAGKEEYKTIKLDCSTENENIIFKIYDNGYGIEPDTLLSLNNITEQTKSYGIKNAYERIKLYYGEDSDISFKSSLNEFTEVVITIPYNLT